MIEQVHVRVDVADGSRLDRLVGDSWLAGLGPGESASLYARVDVGRLSRRTRKRFRALSEDEPDGAGSGRKRPVTPDMDDAEHDIKWLLGEHTSVLVHVLVRFLVRDRRGFAHWERTDGKCVIRRPNSASVWSSAASAPARGRTGPDRDGLVLERVGYYLAGTGQSDWADLVETVAEIGAGKLGGDAADRLGRFYHALDRLGRADPTDEISRRTSLISLDDRTGLAAVGPSGAGLANPFVGSSPSSLSSSSSRPILFGRRPGIERTMTSSGDGGGSVMPRRRPVLGRDEDWPAARLGQWSDHLGTMSMPWMGAGRG